MNDDLSELHMLGNWRVLAYGMTATLIILAGAIFAAVIGPSSMQECGRECGDRSWSWTEGHRRTADGIYVPSHCECQIR